jgi:hypothetical protein
MSPTLPQFYSARVESQWELRDSFEPFDWQEVSLGYHADNSGQDGIPISGYSPQPQAPDPSTNPDPYDPFDLQDVSLGYQAEQRCCPPFFADNNECCKKNNIILKIEHQIAGRIVSPTKTIHTAIQSYSAVGRKCMDCFAPHTHRLLARQSDPLSVVPTAKSK